MAKEEPILYTGERIRAVLRAYKDSPARPVSFICYITPVFTHSLPCAFPAHERRLFRPQEGMS